MHASPTRRGPSAGLLSASWLPIVVTVCAGLALAAYRAGATPPPDPPADPPTLPVGEVTVTATRAEREVLDVPGNVTVIDREQIERSGVANVAELLRRETGIFVTNTTTNPGGYTIDARGFNNGGGNGSNTLVQLDGRRVNEPDSDTPDWAFLPLEEVERIEIVRGATSAIYGDNATGAVINIRSRPREGPPRATLRGFGGRYETAGGSLRAAGTVGPVTGSLLVDGLTTAGYRDQSRFSSQNYKGSLEWNVLDRAAIGIGGGYHTDFRELPGALTPEMIALFGRRAANPDNAGDEASAEGGWIHGWVRAQLSDWATLRIDPFYRPRSDEASFSSLAFGDTQVDTDKESAGFDAQIQLDHEAGAMTNRFVFGGEFLYDDVNRASNSPEPFPGACAEPRTTSHTDGERTAWALFAEEELALPGNVLLSAGVRYDRADFDLAAVNSDPICGGSGRRRPSYDVWSPRASVTWRPLPSLSVYGAYARGFRIPSLDEAAPVVFPAFPVTLPDLDEQVSNGGEIGARYESERISARLNLYYMMVNDEILFDPFFFSNENLDRVRHAGVEAYLAVWPLRWLQVYAGYTYDDVRILDADDPLLEDARMPITPRNRGSLGLFTRLPFDFEFTAHASFVDERVLANDFDRQLPELDAYATLDFLLAWRPQLGEHLEGALRLAVRNVTGEEFDDFGARFDFNPLTFAAEPTAFLYPAPRRTWEAGITITVRR